MIGYYIHHQGAGHATRAACIAAALDQPVVALSSLAPPTGPAPYDDWLTLAPDDAAAGSDPTAGGALHWAPRGVAGLTTRMAAIAGWVAQARPAAVVVDVSVEVTALVRLLGVPVVVVAMPGDRGDAPHQLAYRMAAAILAFWTPAVYAPAWLVPHADRTHHVGALSRFDGRALPAPVRSGRPRGLVLGGAGGSTVAAADRAALPAAYDWEHLGGDAGWRADPWSALCAADVVVTHAGQNALAEVAAAGRPAVIVPQPRPHREQERTAAALGAAGIAHVRTGWPESARWTAELDAARALGGSGWGRWWTGDAARRAAAVVDSVTR